MKKLKFLIPIAFVLFLLSVLCISTSAEIYEADHTITHLYDFPESECNRTLTIKFYDPDGYIVKAFIVHTKRGEEVLTSVSLYDYEITDFESNQGLLETCKMTTSTRVGLESSYLQIRYYFRTALSTDNLSVDVNVRRIDVGVVQKNYKENSPGVYWYYSVDSVRVSANNYFTVTAHDYEGYYVTPGYESSISGNFSFTWFGKYKNIQRSDMIYHTTPPRYESRPDLSEYHKSDGKYDIAPYFSRVIYVNFYYDANYYTLSFNANGGTDAPSSIQKRHGLAVTIPTKIPTRTGYMFCGWGKSPYDSTPDYQPGDTCYENTPIDFYAIWAKKDFSISNLTVSKTEIYQNEVITVKVRTDSWDQVNAYSGIPVELYYDGILLSTQKIDFDVYGIANLTFNLNVGTGSGTHKIEVRINWTDRNTEADTTNNSVSTTINVKREDFVFSMEAVQPNADYTAGRTVITSYLVYNDAERDVIPSTGAKAKFTAYYYNGAEKVIIDQQTWTGVVIPQGGNNLIWFKWTVPEILAGTTVYCECTINGDGSLKEYNLEDNTATLSMSIRDQKSSQTTNPSYESQKPGDYTSKTIPEEKTGSASWTVWEYVNGSFVLKQYGIKVSGETPTLTPGSSCKGAFFENGQWVMKSGYGFTFAYTPTITTLGGYNTPASSAYTDPQSVFAQFPEYGYSGVDGQYRTLYWVDGVWCFAENSGADGDERIHFIPVWYPDGEYQVCVTLTEIWTPAGMVTAVRVTNVILIDGSLYDDWYH